MNIYKMHKRSQAHTKSMWEVELELGGGAGRWSWEVEEVDLGGGSGR